MVTTSPRTRSTERLLEVESFLILRALKSVFEEQGLHLTHDRFTDELEGAFGEQRIPFRALPPDRYLCFGSIQVHLLYETITSAHCEALRRELQRRRLPIGLVVQIGPDRLDCKRVLSGLPDDSTRTSR